MNFNFENLEKTENKERKFIIILILVAIVIIVFFLLFGTERNKSFQNIIIIIDNKSKIFFK